ncbi:MAG: nicotinate (nicotinamide) nucleotide adenylyltransferase [Clostridia bacterium]|nr:nicotinate (nicotinamide) nucleotide adenylyltransferase [Clostridia bacterium]
MHERIALFGGTFDPIHNGHVQLAREFAARLSLDRVLFMPTFVPPHKVKPDLAPAVDRVAMCRLACEPYAELAVSDLEINRRGASFTVFTLEALKRQYPDAELFLLTGADMFLTLGTWYRFADIAAMATLCAAPRDKVTADLLVEHAKQLEQQGARCVVEAIPIVEISSTEIREKATAGKSLEGLVPHAVEEYINQKQLYTANKTYRNTEEQYVDILRGRLTPKRFHHSLEVAKQARHLAKKYGTNPEKAYTAGLLHDILKDTDDDSQLQIFKEFDILLDAVEKQAPKLWHARSGAVFLEHILGIGDTEILEPVRYHTTGRAGMTMPDIVLYLADFTSADRDYPDVEIMRDLTEKDWRAAMQYALAYTVRDLKEQQRPVHPDTLACYREFE